MTQNHSDALVFFGATGDLAYKKIFPALQAMVKRSNFDLPIIGVAKSGWNLDQFKARAKGGENYTARRLGGSSSRWSRSKMKCSSLEHETRQPQHSI
jgi:glucose-6-phosphate 1-dehydrogenase